MAKYRKQVFEVSQYRKQNIREAIYRIDKMSKRQNIERQGMEVTEYQTENINVAKYRTQNMDVAKYRKQILIGNMSSTK